MKYSKTLVKEMKLRGVVIRLWKIVSWGIVSYCETVHFKPN